MASLLVRGVDAEVKERLRARARRNGRSLEAEARAILELAASGAPSGAGEATGFGREMAKLFKDIGLTAAERSAIDDMSDERRRKHRTNFTKSRK